MYSDFDKDTLDDLKEKFGTGVAPLERVPRC